MLSKSCVYALRSIIFIGCNATIDAKIGFKEIANELDLPTPYLAKILQQLSKIKIIQSVKGPRGGFYLDEAALEVSVIKIVEAIDGLDFFKGCGLGLNKCSDEHPCPLHNDFKVFRDGLKELFSSKSIADLITKVEDGDAFIQSILQK